MNLFNRLLIITLLLAIAGFAVALMAVDVRAIDFYFLSSKGRRKKSIVVHDKSQPSIEFGLEGPYLKSCNKNSQADGISG